MRPIPCALTLICALAFATAAPAQKNPAQKNRAGKDEWAKGVPFHTKFEDAIKDVRRTGRILVIYNGWKNSGI